MTTPDKDTIYVDVDDEITTIIDKVHSSDKKIVALVLPKRATVFQSIVNMKLLKRAADVAKKHLVLVTTEANLMPLAGTVGLHVAATPQSKPEIPDTAAAETTEEPVIDEAEYTADNAGDLPVGELAKRSGHVVGSDSEEEMVLPDDDNGTDGTQTAKLKKIHSLKVPNFNRFRLRLVLGVLAVVLLVVGLYYANVVAPNALITITTNTSDVNVDLTMSLDSSATKLDKTKLVVPAKAEQKQQTTSQQVNATGEKNTGVAATGTVDMTAEKCSGSGNPDDVPAGTGVSSNGLTFITQENTKFHITGFSNGCATYSAGNPTDITAISGGAKYNVDNVTFTIAGRSDVSATGSAANGTDNIITIISQADIDNATKKLASAKTDAIKAGLEQALRTDGMYPLPQTFKAGKPVVTTSGNAGDQADTVTVTQAVTYTMLGAQQSDLDALVKAAVDAQIDTHNESILDDGLATGTLAVSDNTGSKATAELQTKATVGPDISVDSIKSEAAGKKIGDIKTTIKAIPGVSNVDVQLSPFWVSAIPSNPQKITVTISKAS